MSMMSACDCWPWAQDDVDSQRIATRVRFSQRTLAITHASAAIKHVTICPGKRVLNVDRAWGRSGCVGMEAPAGQLQDQGPPDLAARGCSVRIPTNRQLALHAKARYCRCPSAAGLKPATFKNSSRSPQQRPWSFPVATCARRERNIHRAGAAIASTAACIAKRSRSRPTQLATGLRDDVDARYHRGCAYAYA